MIQLQGGKNKTKPTNVSCIKQEYLYLKNSENYSLSLRTIIAPKQKRRINWLLFLSLKGGNYMSKAKVLSFSHCEN